jgi:hypothetical protein
MCHPELFEKKNSRLYYLDEGVTYGHVILGEVGKTL